MIPKKQQFGWLGIDVGTSAIKVAQLARLGNSIALLDAAIVQRRHGWSAEQLMAHQPPSSAHEICAAVTLAENCSGVVAACVAPAGVCRFRELELSLTGPNARQECGHQFAAMGDLDLNNDVFDYWPANTEDEANESDRYASYAVAMSQSWSDHLASDLAQANLQCVNIDVTPLAIARAIHCIDPQSETAPAMVIDWGYSSITICIVVAQRAVFVRHLQQYGCSEFCGLVHDALNVIPDEGRILLRDIGLSAKQSSPIDHLVTEAVAGHAAGFTGELQRTLTYIDSHRPSISPYRLYLMGAGAMMGGVAEFIQNQIGIDSSVFSIPFAEAGLSTAAAPALLGPAVGMSLLAWDKS